MSKPIITISRQYGSGGRAVGEALAKKLGIPLYDKEYLMEAAKDAGFTKAMFERLDETTKVSLLYSLSIGKLTMHPTDNPKDASPFLGDELYKWQCGKIRELAAQGPAVFVGRTADYVLRNDPNHISIFIHAPEKARVQRIMEKEGVVIDEAERLVRSTEKARENYYNFYTDQKWGALENYDLCIDASRLGVDGAVDLILAVVERCT